MGCGYSEAFQRAGWVYNTLTEEKRGGVLDLLHDLKTGAGFSMLRIGIGSSPNSTEDWMNGIEAKKDPYVRMGGARLLHGLERQQLGVVGARG